MKWTADSLAILRDLRSLKVVVIHPQDQDGDELLAQLHRIGCDVTVCWPTLDCLPFGTGLVLMAMRPETLSADFPWLGTSLSPPVIPVVTCENPITVEAVLRLNALTTIPSPVRSFGLLTAIAVALTQCQALRVRDRYIERLEKKQAKVRVVQQATQILMERRGVSEEHAYQSLRSKAMLKREPIEVVASDIVKAHETLTL
ncbi:ANTAR domain-containing protein [Paraburkholderia sp. FT54]|uniref:ANTAR domain-containing response regulator n=1 Tax=Paraburkholderia sp. FT54 TaxID=3074437 RepID=UPI0028780739|nr:ANTAR domain-containing protein [Paraburkholderia sp. FT54]WNC92315.1 ANTAR domain-containing protein [Paraburkholderia sp. FT54]